MAVKKLELHPLCTFFPRMDGAEFEELKADILAHGLRQRIIVHKGMILDGGNRYRACIEVGVTPATTDYNGDDPVSFVMSQNMHRRHLSSGQRAAIVASAADWAKAQPAYRPKAGNVTGLSTVAARAAESGASEKTQRDADQVARADPELAKAVGHGEVTLAEAKEKVTGKPRKPPKPKAEPDHDNRLAAAIQMNDETQAENRELQARIDALTVTDLAKKVDELVRANAHAVREKDVEMDKNAILLKRANDAERFRSEVVKISGAQNPKAAIQWVKSMAATQRMSA